jgi:dimethylamine/trimethylamine dehydrogenase
VAAWLAPGNPESNVLIVGAGPAGLECARALGQRGYRVTLAEAREELGGRVSIESSLPGLASWARVRDYRINLLQRMSNVDIYRGSLLSARDVLDYGCHHAIIATGASWTRNVLSTMGHVVSGFDDGDIYTPDDVLSGRELAGPIVIYDFDHYYMGSCLAELLRLRGLEVTIATPASGVAAWTFMNNDLGEIRARMIELDVGIVLDHFVTGFENGAAELTSAFRDATVSTIDCASLVVVGARQANDSLFQALDSDPEAVSDAGIETLRSIGDSRAPGTIAHAVYSGHECARSIDADGSIDQVARERPLISSLKEAQIAWNGQ